ncbi:putative ubiquitin fusion degradation protein [Phaeoacremonium minimum UCRPA7]|uniref:Putative ubiquitin fusion degradation protein n=1 Tax=Phaeoacremonium minimum (strain UCR-PA7) TaxID=1286976 RepID=R8BKX7_PHAM7|nr:putative ubiquitin fusion degradation protein [Phaeoacremonium minimum UCRPA7]EOO00004.1 putative ubiquitin fusion degradation protein [Phaeoacremonium minimum UCRPA7]
MPPPNTPEEGDGPQFYGPRRTRRAERQARSSFWTRRRIGDGDEWTSDPPSRSPTPPPFGRIARTSVSPAGSDITTVSIPEARQPAVAEVVQVDWQALEYVGTVDENLLCPICKTPFLNPHTTKACGHTFCKDCLGHALELRSACPICRTNFSQRHTVEVPCPRIVHAQLDKLEVKCPNRLCKWKGIRSLVEHHIRQQCEYTLVACPDRECSKKIIRLDADKDCMHYTGPCIYCKDIIEMAQLELHYETVCRGHTGKCEFCGNNVVRHKKEAHEQDCQNREAACAFAPAGCTFKGKGIELPAHEANCGFGVFMRLEQRHKDEMDKAKDRMEQQMEQVLQRKEQQIKAQLDHNITNMLRAVEDSVVQHITERIEQRFPHLNLAAPVGAGRSTLPSGLDGPKDASSSQSAAEGHCQRCDARDEYMFSMFADVESRINNLAKAMQDQDARHSVMLFNEVLPLKESLTEARSQHGVVSMHVRWLMDIQRQKRALDRQTLNGVAAAAAAVASTLPSGSNNRPSDGMTGQASAEAPQPQRRMSDRTNPPRL